MLYALIIYWGISMDESAGANWMTFFAVYLLMLIMTQLCVSLGLLISAMAPNMTTAATIAPLFTMPMV